MVYGFGTISDAELRRQGRGGNIHDLLLCYELNVSLNLYVIKRVR